MKIQNRSIRLAFSVLAIFFFSVGGSFAEEYVKVPYVTNATGWFTGVAVTNLTGHAIPHIYCDFIHQDGSFLHIALDVREDRADMGAFGPYEMKIFMLDDLYPGTLPAAAYWLWFWHSEGNYPYGVAVFISNNFAGIGGYAFQQFFSENND